MDVLLDRAGRPDDDALLEEALRGVRARIVLASLSSGGGARPLKRFGNWAEVGHTEFSLGPTGAIRSVWDAESSFGRRVARLAPAS